MKTRALGFLLSFILLSLASCGQERGDHETILSMNINGQDWKADRVEQNIVAQSEEDKFYDIYIGGGNDLDGFSIRIEVDENQLHNLKGRYPIYNFYTDSKSGQVYLLPNFSDFTYYSEGHMDEYNIENEKKILGYLEVESARFESSENKLRYSELSGKFDAQFKGEKDDGKMKEITITNGYFHISQSESD